MSNRCKPSTFAAWSVPSSPAPPPAPPPRPNPPMCLASMLPKEHWKHKSQSRFTVHDLSTSSASTKSQIKTTNQNRKSKSQIKITHPKSPTQNHPPKITHLLALWMHDAPSGRGVGWVVLSTRYHICLSDLIAPNRSQFSRLWTLIKFAVPRRVHGK